MNCTICVALSDLVQFAQFKKNVKINLQLKPATLRKVTHSSVGAFYVFKIVQIATNCAKRHMYSYSQ